MRLSPGTLAGPAATTSAENLNGRTQPGGPGGLPTHRQGDQGAPTRFDARFSATSGRELWVLSLPAGLCHCIDDPEASPSPTLLQALDKLPFLLRLLPRHPVEVWDRVMTTLARRLDGLYQQPSSFSYSPMEMNESLDALAGMLAVDTSKILEESSLRITEQRLLNQITMIRRKGCVSLKHNGDFNVGRCCYLFCRALRPAVVLEIGVAYGLTTSFLLDALSANGQGNLWSIDLPPLGPPADDFVGILVPKGMRSRWQLQRGVSNRVLPRLLLSLGQVDVFVHDSLHTYTNMKSEFRTVWPFLRAGGVLIANKVEGNSAFLEFAEEVRPAFCAVTRQGSKNSLFGLLVKDSVQRAGPEVRHLRLTFSASASAEKSAQISSKQ